MEETYYKKGLWSVEEDQILMDYVRVHGKGRWNRIPKTTGLKRCGKSCRLRWMNYLCPSVKKGGFSEEEDDLIIRLHNLLGNRWSLIAGRVPGRTDNQVKNHWNTYLIKKLGIGKKRSDIGAASVTLSKEGGEGEETQKLSNGLTPELACHDGIGGVAGSQAVEGSQDPSKATSPHETNCLMSSCWFPDDNVHVIAPSLVELLDGYPLDDIWH